MNLGRLHVDVCVLSRVDHESMGHVWQSFAPLLNLPLLFRPLLCHRVTENIIDDGSMSYDGSMGHDGLWATMG